MPKYHKLQRGVCLALFLTSSILSCIQFHTNAVIIAGLSLIGIIAYDIVCFFKEKHKFVDYGADIEQIKASQVELSGQVKDIRNDSSIGKLAETFKRNR